MAHRPTRPSPGPAGALDVEAPQMQRLADAIFAEFCADRPSESRGGLQAQEPRDEC